MNVLGRIELAHEPEFVLGRLTVSPSRRELVRDDGQREVIEHRVMQVLIALSKAEGDIVTRDELIMSCWGGRVVGEDSIHRVMSRLRKVANGIGAGSFEIETITKIGYRLISDIADPAADEVANAPVASAATADQRRMTGRKVAAMIIAAGLLLAAGLLAWAFLGRNPVPLVAVGPADSSARSQLLARDLLVKLGTLPQVGSGRWQLVDTASARSAPSLMFQTTLAYQSARFNATLTLLDGSNNNVLWSREFAFPASRESDLRQHVSLTAARVLDCALQARKERGLPADLFRLFLTGCAALAETSMEDPHQTARLMRAVVTRRPDFAPAWARIVMIDANILQLARNGSGDVAASHNTLLRDIEQARKVAPGLPEIDLVQLDMLPPDRFADAQELLRRLKTRAPDSPAVWLADALAWSRVGRMGDAVQSARRAVELDPLSPALSSGLISLLAWSGSIEAAREELRRAERLWPGTGALRDAQFAYHLRYGDPKIARHITSGVGYVGDGDDPYLLARLNPSAANIERMVRTLRRYKASGNSQVWAYAVQALGEFHRTDEVFDWLQRYPPGTIASGSYVLFRPALAEVRRDTRFMRVAKRIGLVDYWIKSGHWPDFCLEPGLPYDCRQEAARLKS